MADEIHCAACDDVIQLIGGKWCDDLASLGNADRYVTAAAMCAKGGEHEPAYPLTTPNRVVLTDGGWTITGPVMQLGHWYRFEDDIVVDYGPERPS